MTDKKRNIKINNIIRLISILAVIVLINIISSFLYTRFDLTSEKRYTLSDATRNMLSEIDDLVYFRVYLDGEFPAGFKKLSRETKEMLNEFRAYNKNIEYDFINPSESADPDERKNIYRDLISKGLNPTDLQVKTKDGTSQQLIFPGAIVSYRGREVPLKLLVSQQTQAPEEILNNSVQNLEFSIADAIRKLTAGQKPKIAFIEGHGELDKNKTADITNALREYYVVDRIRINEKLNSLSERTSIDSLNTRIKNKYKAIIIAKPDSAFSEKDKFIIDQFVMRGGKILWLIDPVFASMDSLQINSEMLGMTNDLNLADLFFRYGIRLNNNLVMDLNALPIPVKTGQVGDQPQFDFFPWPYFPILMPISDNPIVKNLNAIKTEFISSIDLVKSSPGTYKTVLLNSSGYSRTINVPVMITLDILSEKPDERLYNKKFIPVAVLLEGKFESLYNNRIPPEIQDNKDIGFLPESEKTKMIVIADGDIIKNQMQFSQGQYYPLPLGYDKYTGQTFGNKELILNAMNYLTDDSGLISIRSRELKLRLLDRTKVDRERTFWQVLNTVLPIFIVMLFGLAQAYFRKRKYTR